MTQKLVGLKNITNHYHKCSKLKTDDFVPRFVEADLVNKNDVADFVRMISFDHKLKNSTKKLL